MGSPKVSLPTLMTLMFSNHLAGYKNMQQVKRHFYQQSAHVFPTYAGTMQIVNDFIKYVRINQPANNKVGVC